MPDENLGNNVATVPTSNANISGEVAQLTALMEAGKTLLNPSAPEAAPAANPTSTPPPATGTTPAPQNADGNKDSLQQFRDKEGNVDLSKIEKANENLTKAIESKEDRQARLLAINKDLMRKHTKASQEVKATEKELTELGFNPSRLTEEDRIKIAKDIEKDAVGTIVKLADELARKRVEERLDERIKPMESDWKMDRERKRNDALVDDLDGLVKAGHNWVFSPEGAARFDEVFERRPYLLQSATPYSDAIRFMNLAPTGEQGSSAPATAKAPILGAMHAAPPPISSTPASPGDALQKLSAEMLDAIGRGELKRAADIKARMESLHRDLMPDAQ
jgi:hypothetical protein